MSWYSVNSEYNLLKAVLLCKPRPEIGDIGDPKEVLHLRKIDLSIMKKEYREVLELYKRLGIKSYFIDSRSIKNTDGRYMFNMMFTRDLFFMTAHGALISRMASAVRRDEIRYVEKTLKKNGVRIRKIIQGDGTFEGADALWVNPGLVAVGVGNRTNEEGFRQVKRELRRDGVQCVRLPAPEGALHLLGALQFIDRSLALVRVGLVSPEIMVFLKKNRIKIIEIPENSEVKERQSLNFVTIAPRRIIMPAGCPRTKIIFKRHGIKVAAEISITQLIKGGGGIACTTGILARIPR